MPADPPGPAALVVLEGAPHGGNVSPAQEFNQALIGFLSR
jgi:pimeloyl-ACP methyl ester carboxylesterase